MAKLYNFPPPRAWEENVLSCCLCLPFIVPRLINEYLEPADFYYGITHTAFKAICDLYEWQRTCTKEAIKDAMDKAIWRLWGTQGLEWLNTLPTLVKDPPNWRCYAAAVAGAANKRDWIDSLQRKSA